MFLSCKEKPLKLLTGLVVVTLVAYCTTMYNAPLSYTHTSPWQVNSGSTAAGTPTNAPAAPGDAWLQTTNNKRFRSLGFPPVDFPPALKALVTSRCARFSSGNDGRGGTLALVHVQKNGGNSLQGLLTGQARRSGKLVMKTRFCRSWCSGSRGPLPSQTRLRALRSKENLNNCLNGQKIQHKSEDGFLPVDFTNKTAINECVKQILGDADVLISHQDFSYVESELNWKRGQSDWITLLRNPVDRMESRYKWEQQQGRLKGVNRFVKENFQWNFDKFVLQDKRFRDSALFMHASVDDYNSLVNCRHCDFADLDPKLQLEYLVNLTMNIASRFSVIGVLDRMEETLEVAHCRHPWIAADAQIPHSNPSKMDFPHKLERNESLIQKMAIVDTHLYKFANQLLSIDVDCCRSQRKLQFGVGEGAERNA